MKRATIQLSMLSTEVRAIGYFYVCEEGHSYVNHHTSFEIEMEEGSHLTLIEKLSKHIDTYSHGECHFSKCFNQIIREKLDIYIVVFGVSIRYKFNDIKHLLVQPIHTHFREDVFINYDRERDFNSDLRNSFNGDFNAIPTLLISEALSEFGWIWAAND